MQIIVATMSLYSICDQKSTSLYRQFVHSSVNLVVGTH